MKIYRQFYLTYPQLLPEISHFLLPFMQKGQSLTDQLQLPSKQPITISQSLTDQFKMQSEGSYLVAPEDLFNRLNSFSIFASKIEKMTFATEIVNY